MFEATIRTLLRWTPALVLVPGLGAQTPVEIQREPRHRLVRQEGSVLILDVQVQPGDTTLYHIHDAAILYVPISISPVDAQILGRPWNGVGPRDTSRFRPDATASDTLYAIEPVTHRVTNVGSSLFRLIGVVNRQKHPAGGTLQDSLPPGTLERNSSWFRQTRLTLAAGAASAWYTTRLPLVLVQPAAGRTSVERDPAGAASPMAEAGTWVYLAAGTRFRIRNDGAGSNTIVLVQVR